MTQGILTVQLERDGPCSPWGFRLYGGLDVGCPLSVQRVFLGSPSEGELKSGDLILKIGDRDTNKLSHQAAHDIIKKAGNHLSLVIQRIQSGSSRSSAATPTTSTPHLSGGNPLASAATPSISTTMNRPMPGFYATLPTTQFTDNYRPFAPEPQALAAVEQHEFFETKTREKDAIVHQAYRTLPLIAPKAKSIHDYPVGSYLRHVHDPNWTNPPHQGATPIQNLAAIRKIQQASAMTNVPVMTSNNPSHHGTESVPVYLRQYNSPINMYSTQNVADTLEAQTGLQPSSAQYQASKQVASYLSQPSRPTAMPFQVSDITKSPTYRLIHDDEFNDSNKKEYREPQPVANRVYDAPTAEEPPVNYLGVPKGKILQSGSFNTIMSTLTIGQSQQ